MQVAVNGFERFCEGHEEELTQLVQTFADYEPLSGLDRAHLRRWLRQFQAQHRELALKLAGLISYYSTDKINGLMGTLHGLIKQQIKSEGVAGSDVYYVPFGRSGESGEDTVRRFRNFNKLDRLKEQFVKAFDIQGILLKKKSYEPVVFFLDDFVGTGEQVTGAWHETIHQMVPEYLRLYLAVVAGTAEGADRIEKDTPFKVIAVHTIGSRQELMAKANTALSDGDKRTIKRYCQQAGNHPLGFGEKGLLVSFAYGTPNNTLSVVRGSKGQRPWAGLLPPWGDL